MPPPDRETDGYRSALRRVGLGFCDRGAVQLEDHALDVAVIGDVIDDYDADAIEDDPKDIATVGSHKHPPSLG